MNKILESVKDKLSFLNAIFILPICRLVLGEKAFNELVKENNENAEKQVLKDTPIKQDKKEDKNTTQEKDKTNDQKEITEKPENTKENIPEKTNVNEHIDLNDKVPEDMIPKVGDIVTPDCEYDYTDEGCYEIDGFTLQESLYDMMECHCEMEQREMYTAAVPVEDNYPYYDTLEGQGDVVNDFREMLADAEYCDDVIVAPESVYDNSITLNEDFYCDMTLDEIEQYDMAENNYDMMERHCEMEQREMYTTAVPVEDNYPYYDTLEGQGDVVNDFREMLADAEYCDDVIVAPESVYDNSTALNEDFYRDMTLDEIEQYDMAENNYYMEMAENMPDYDDCQLPTL